ncbi:MAG: hypothetical protein KY444_10275 [Gemmatimonadetes bacterium]|nr:hypothetical protein [Gemmatimonadota bacterium]
MPRSATVLLYAAAILAGCAKLEPSTWPDVPAGADVDTLAALITTASAAAPRVLASRREILVIFPRDTAVAWGWSELRDREYHPAYHWGISIEGIDGPRSISASIGRGYEEGARSFASFAELIAAAEARYCRPGMIADCPPADVTALVQDGALVLAMRDSARIARLVGLRPAWAAVWHGRPEVPRTYPSDSVHIEYVDPQVPEPDSAVRVEAAAARRRYEASVNSIIRYISAPGITRGEVWMAVGDSVRFSADEHRCHFDVCGGRYDALTASGWTVGDSSVVRLRPFVRPGRRFEREPAVWVVARRIGRTSVRVHGLSGSADTLPSREPVARELQVRVVVTAPVGRVQLSPRQARAQVGQPLRVRARAFDVRGRVIPGAPIRVEIIGGPYGRIMDGADLRHFAFESAGRHTLIASFGGRADTLMVDVAADPGATALPGVATEGAPAVVRSRDPATGEFQRHHLSATLHRQAPGLHDRRLAGSAAEGREETAPAARTIRRARMSGPNARSAPKRWEAVVADLAEKQD